jgi:UDP-2,4-diacetamido-2,4,6-trideoxy-beta-L-altropyranose hydrolase
VVFASRTCADDLNSYVESEGFTVHKMDAVDEAGDAAETSAILIKAACDWVIVDHYSLGLGWEETVRPHLGKLLVIDDLGRRHSCDVLVDQNLVAGFERRYDGMLSVGAVSMLGPTYALLQDDYADLQPLIKRRNFPPRRIVLYFGDGDVHGMTGRCLAALLSLDRSELSIDVVLRASSPQLATILEISSKESRVHLHHRLPSLAPLFLAADLAVGAGGATSWERLCLGLPSIIITVAENQEAPAAELSGRGLAVWIGRDTDLDKEELQAKLAAALDHPMNGLIESSTLVDGRGAVRIAAYLTINATTRLLARRATIADEVLLLRWANDPTTRAMAFHTAPIGARTHHEWLQARLASSDCRLFIVEAENGIPVGQVRFDQTAEGCVISYSMDRIFRGKGLGTRVVEAAISASPAQDAALIARIRPENVKSRRVLEKLGFTQTALDGSAVEFRRSQQEHR